MKRLSIETLRNLDGGRIAVAFDQAITRAREDCIDRPALGGVRKVQLVASFKPVVDGEGDLDSIDVQFDIKEAIPARKSKAYNMRADDAGLFFNELSPERADQQTFEAMGDPEDSRDRAGA